MPTTRVAYLERDIALRGFVARLLLEQPGLELSDVVATPAELLDADLRQVDVVLFDLDLGPAQVSGLELGLALRARFADLGIVLFTADPVPDLSTSLPPAQQRGWSVVAKGIDVDGVLLAETLASTARGLNVIDPALPRGFGSSADHAQLTARQRRIMTLASQGMDGRAIAASVGLAAVTVRQELSRAYDVLVPDARDGVDLRTLAVLRFLRGSTSARLVDVSG